MGMPLDVVSMIVSLGRSMQEQPLAMPGKSVDSSWRIHDYGIIKGHGSKKVNTRTRTRKCGRGY